MSSARLEAPELTQDALLVLEDPAFSSDNVAIVTGAASGIGKALSAALAINGLTVVGADIDEDGVDETAETVAEFDPSGRFVSAPTDLTSNEDIEAVVEASTEAGELTFVANVAGLQHIASIQKFPVDQYDLLQSVMLRAPFLLTKHAIGHLADGDRGAIATMSSVHGHIATAKKPAYIAAKHGINGLTKAIAAEGAGDVRGFSVSVGYVLTPLMVDQIADTAAERGISEEEVVDDVMLGPAQTTEMMSPADVANLFVFGFSRYATHLNGSDLCFDGGFTTTYE